MELPLLPKPFHFNNDHKKPMKAGWKVKEDKWYSWSPAAEKSTVHLQSLTVNDAISDLPSFDWSVSPTNLENNMSDTVYRHLRENWDELASKDMPSWLGFENKNYACSAQNYFQLACRKMWQEDMSLQQYTPLYSTVVMRK
jgi:hypothetical protein